MRLTFALSLVFLVSFASADRSYQAINDALNKADTLVAKIADAQRRYDELLTRQKNLDMDLDSNWLLVCGILVFFFPMGLGLYEVGAVRSLNVQGVLAKNIIIAAVTTFAFWFLGWGLSYGNLGSSTTRNAFIGNGDVFLASDGGEFASRKYGRWFFEWACALVPATIVCNSVSERLRLPAVALITLFTTAFTYPVVVHWAWSTAGWLSPFAEEIENLGTQGMFDFAGSGVIHLVGGAAAMAVLIIVGPRAGRYTEEGRQKYVPNNKSVMTLGMFFVWFGFFATTIGRSLVMSGDDFRGGSRVASKVMINTVLGGGGGAVAALLLARGNLKPFFDVRVLHDSVLAGFVAVAAPCALVEPWAALTIGFVGGIFYLVVSNVVEARELDDTLNTISIHMVPGIWGLISVGLLATRTNVIRTYGDFSQKTMNTLRFGLFYGGGGEMLWVQTVGMIAIFFWSLIVSFVVIVIVKYFVALRLGEEEEDVVGFDTCDYAHIATKTSSYLINAAVFHDAIAQEDTKAIPASQYPGQRGEEPPAAV